MKGRPASKRRSPRRSTGTPVQPRPQAHGRFRMVWMAVAIGVAVAAILAFLTWDTQQEMVSELEMFGDGHRLPPGDPPLDAAAVLGLNPQVPQTVSEINEEILAVGKLVMTTLPQRPEAYAQMAVAHLQVGQERAALESWQRALEQNPSFAEGHLGMGVLLKEFGEDEAAIASLSKAIEVNPELEPAYRELTSLLLQQRRTEQAVEVARQCVQRFPDQAENHYWLGQAFLQHEDYEAASRSYEQTLRLAPDYSPALHSLAVAAARMGDKDRATQYQKRFAERKALELEAERQEARNFDDLASRRQALSKRHAVAGVLQLQVGDPRMAEAHWLRAAAIDSQERTTRQALATLYEQQSRTAAAVQMLEELCRLEPEQAEYFLRKGRLLVGLGADLPAREALQQTLQLAPQTAEAHRMLAQIHLRSATDWPTAVAHAETAARLAPSSDTYLVLAAVQSQSGDLAGARAALSRALQMDPDNPRTRRAYERLRELD
ncbi:MAG: tetratricopeptide repeat protein [Planctomycetaceae bacterium]|nr:MAG: tetratricopeptide repeat protein [Planctomycetaceae bacterium]